MKPTLYFALFFLLLFTSKDHERTRKPSCPKHKIGQWDHRPTKDVTT